MNRNKDEHASSVPLFCDFFETLLHNFLYHRHLYPPESFELHQKFGVPAQICTQAEVLTYVESLITGLVDILEEDRIERIEMCVMKVDNDSIEETFVVEPLSMPRYPSDQLTVKEMFTLETLIRSSLLNAIQIFASRPKPNFKSGLEKRTWAMKVHTKMSAYKRLLNKEKIDCPVKWLVAGMDDENEDGVGVGDGDDSFEIVPMTNLMSRFLQVQLYVKDYTNCRTC